MSYREKRERLKKQINELNEMVEQLNKVGPKHQTYAKYRLTLLTSGMRLAIKVLIGVLGFVLLADSSDMPLCILGAAALLTSLISILVDWTGGKVVLVSCDRKGCQLIEEKLIETRKMLQEFEDEKAQLEPLKRKFERLEDVILQMGGKFKIKQRLHRHRVKVKFEKGGFWYVYHMTETDYEDLVVDLDKKRKKNEARKETVERFEAELK